jgi:NADH:ubiquinone oxidoreductase subunit 4 (subunit M)
MIIIALFQDNYILAILSLTSLLFSVIIGFWVLTRICYGNYDVVKERINIMPLVFNTDLSRREILIVTPFIILVMLFGIKPNLIANILETSL